MSTTIIEGVCNYDDNSETTRDDDEAERGDAAKGTESGAPVKGRSEKECEEATNIENGMRLKEVKSKLNELKKIAENVKNQIYGNTKQIKKNKLANAQMQGAVGDGDMDEEDKAAEAKQDAVICKKYPQSCGGDDEEPKQTISGSSYMDAIGG